MTRRDVGVVLALTLLGLALFLFTERVVAGSFGVPLDDAWIHYQFARNLSLGNGFSYNPGEPTPGSTSPLWTLLLAGVGLFTHDFLWPSLVLSAAFLLATAVLTCGLTNELTGSRWAGVVAGVATGLTGRLLWVGLAGMETTAFAALSVAGVWLFVRQGLRPLPVLLLALAAQVRPEGHALFAVVGLLALRAEVIRWSGVQVAMRRLGGAVLLYGLIALPYVLFSWQTTGHPLPNTFYAKAGSQYLFSWRTLRETVRLHWLDNPVSIVLLPLGAVALWRRGKVLVLWLLLLPLLTAVIVDFVWHHGRYTMPLLPFQMIVAAAGLWWLAQRLPPAAKGWLPVSMALLALGGAWRLPHWAVVLGNNVREIQQIDEALGRWLAENAPPDAVVAVDDIGAIAFLGERRVFDLNGLVTPAMWPAMREGAFSPTAVRLMADAGVTHLALFPAWHGPLVTTGNMAQPLASFTTETQTIIGSREAGIYAASWPYGADDGGAETAVWQNGIALLEPTVTVQADRVDVELIWRAATAVAEDYTVFVHVLNGAGEIVAQVDERPYAGLAPTNLWPTDKLVRQPLTIPLPPELSLGQYRLSVGLYLPETGARLPLATGGDTVEVGQFSAGE